jgi:hypothetical protein
MKFIIFKEDNKKEHETFIFFLQYDGNENIINTLKDIIESTDFSEMDGDYSTFEINTHNKISEKTVEELCSIQLGSYSDLFSECRGDFNFPYDDFEFLSDTEKARKLDELFYACQIRNYFKINNTDFKVSNEALQDLKNIFEEWNNNSSQNDIYHLILDWINNYEDSFSEELKKITKDIKKRMNDNDETNDIAEDFIYGKYSDKLKNIFK